MATQTVSRILRQVLPTSTASPIFTASNLTNLRDLQVCSQDGSSRTYKIYIIPSGEGVANKGYICGAAKPLAAGITDTYRFNHMLAAGDKIYAAVDSGVLVSIQASAIVSTGSFTGVQPKRMVQAELTGSSTLLYTATKQAIVKDITVCAFDGTTPTFYLAATAGGAADSASYVFYNYALTAYQTLPLRFSLVMEAGGKLYGHASGANKVAINISGVEAV